MRHDVDRYRMLLETETNPRARKVLLGMIEELEGRVTDDAVITVTTTITVAEKKLPTYIPGQR